MHVLRSTILLRVASTATYEQHSHVLSLHDFPQYPVIYIIPAHLVIYIALGILLALNRHPDWFTSNFHE